MDEWFDDWDVKVVENNATQSNLESQSNQDKLNLIWNNADRCTCISSSCLTHNNKTSQSTQVNLEDNQARCSSYDPWDNELARKFLKLPTKEKRKMLNGKVVPLGFVPIYISSPCKFCFYFTSAVI
ncbi:uncharacterized protein [Clytia hemisphaerica]|uniref:uncharacterized protein n=1 Tax=Clytia hemisphaerica TaxID=252671 RepID=UPI0034D54863